MEYIRLLSEPANQLIAMLTLLALVSLFVRFSPGDVLLHGMYYFIAWMVLGFIYSFFTEHPWDYWWQIALSYIACIIIWLCLAVLLEKFTDQRVDMGWWAVIAVANIFIVIMGLQLLVVGVRKLI